MYQYPPPQYYAPPPPRIPRTIPGVRWSFVGLVLVIGYFATLAVAAVVMGAAVAGLPASPSISQILSALALAIVFGIVAVILGILVLVFYLIGVGYLYGGRNEFGPAHARNVRIAFILLLVAISLGLASGVAQFILASSVFTITGFSITFNPGTFYALVVVGIVMGIFVAAFMAAHLVLSIRALARPQHQIVLNAAAALGTATPGIAGAITLLQMPRVVAAMQALADSATGGFFTGLPTIDPSWGLPAALGGILSIAAMFLFLFVFRDVNRRLFGGELKPILPPPQPVTPWMNAPVLVPGPPGPASPPPTVPWPQAPPPGSSP